MKSRHSTDLLFMVALFFGFAATALLAVVLGAKVYQNVQRSFSDNYDVRTSLLYVSQKLAQADNPAELRVEGINSADALVLPRQVEGENYETWIFLGDGYLREVTVRAGTKVGHKDGQPIMPLGDLQLTRQSNLLHLEVVSEKGAAHGTWINLDP